MSEQTEAAKAPLPMKPEAEKALIAMGETGLKLASLDDAYRFAQYVANSGIAPKGDTAATVLVKLQAGAEIGFPPMQSLSAFVVVHGRLSIMGQAALAKIRSSGVARSIRVGCAGDGDERFGYCDWHRADTGEAGREIFSVSDAKRAGLWERKSKTGEDMPWVGYPDDMLIWRAVSRTAKRYFSDVLMGFDVAEVVREYRTLDAPVREQLPPAEVDTILEELEA